MAFRYHTLYVLEYLSWKSLKGRVKKALPQLMHSPNVPYNWSRLKQRSRNFSQVSCVANRHASVLGTFCLLGTLVASWMGNRGGTWLWHLGIPNGSSTITIPTTYLIFFYFPIFFLSLILFNLNIKDKLYVLDNKQNGLS